MGTAGENLNDLKYRELFELDVDAPLVQLGPGVLLLLLDLKKKD